jgi:hypothetical protein
MIDRAREIAQMMGYASIDATLEAIGKGELILLKMPEEERQDVAQWLRSRIPEVRDSAEELGDMLEELASGLDFFAELRRYPPGADVCEMDLPHGWPSYCDKDAKL